MASDDRAAEAASYHALCAYTLTRGDPGFIHQHVVDAFAAQNADANTKPITLAFALIGPLERTLNLGTQGANALAGCAVGDDIANMEVQCRS